MKLHLLESIIKVVMAVKLSVKVVISFFGRDDRREKINFQFFLTRFDIARIFFCILQ